MNSFLTKISDLFSKDILFASLLPVLLFFFTLAALAVFLLGSNELIVIYNAQSTNSVLFLSFSTTLILIITAYFFHSIRNLMLKFWSGESPAFLFASGVTKHTVTLRKMRTETDAISSWMREYEEYEKNKKEISSQRPTHTLPAEEEEKFLSAIQSLKKPPSEYGTKELFKGLLHIKSNYSEASFNKLHSALWHWNKDYMTENQVAAAALDRTYGSSGIVKGTGLGNVIQAYNEYSFSRYAIEAEVFWPRIQKVIDKEYHELIYNQRITLDFSITSATLSLLFILLCVVLGPVLYSQTFLWLILIVIGSIVCYVCYRMALNAAVTLGNLIRSSYDLYRLKLIRTLGLKFPETRKKEKEQWKMYSQLVTYGQTDDFEIVDYEKSEKQDPKKQSGS